MPSPEEIDRHLRSVRLRKRGSWIVASEDRLRQQLLDQLSKTPGLSAEGHRFLAGIVNGSVAANFDSIFCSLMRYKNNFKSVAQWTLCWAICIAVDGLLDEIAGGGHETGLTGSLIRGLRTALKQLDLPEQTSHGLEDVIAFHFGDHGPNWMESRTGADFGLIIELLTENGKAYYVSHVQAKRALGRINVDIDQAKQLHHYGIGTYLFYNQKTFGIDQQIGLPTVKSSTLVIHELANAGSTDPFSEASDLAVRLAMDFTIAAGVQRFDTPEKAITALFALDKQPNVGAVLVALLGEGRFEAEEAYELEQYWRGLTDRARKNIREGRNPFQDAPEPIEEPDPDGVHPKM